MRIARVIVDTTTRALDRAVRLRRARRARRTRCAVGVPGARAARRRSRPSATSSGRPRRASTTLQAAARGARRRRSSTRRRSRSRRWIADDVPVHARRRAAPLPAARRDARHRARLSRRPGRGPRGRAQAACSTPSAAGGARVAALRRRFGQRADASSPRSSRRARCARTYRSRVRAPARSTTGGRARCATRAGRAARERDDCSARSSTRCRRARCRVAELAAQLGAVDGALKRLAKRGHRRGRAPPALPASRGARPRGAAPRASSRDGQTRRARRDRAARAAPAAAPCCSTASPARARRRSTCARSRRVSPTAAGASCSCPRSRSRRRRSAASASRFGDAVAVLHSRLSAGERYDQWDLAAHGRGVASSSARARRSSRRCRDLAARRDRRGARGELQAGVGARATTRATSPSGCARARGAVLVLGSRHARAWRRATRATRAAARACACRSASRGRCRPSRSSTWPREFADGHRSMFSRPLLDGARARRGDGREGRPAPEPARLRAASCSAASAASCPSARTAPSRSPTTRPSARLVCHHCGASTPVPADVPASAAARTCACSARARSASRPSSPRPFPALPVVRMDADTTTGKGGARAARWRSSRRCPVGRPARHADDREGARLPRGDARRRRQRRHDAAPARLPRGRAHVPAARAGRGTRGPRGRGRARHHPDVLAGPPRRSSPSASATATRFYAEEAATRRALRLPAVRAPRQHPAHRARPKPTCARRRCAVGERAARRGAAEGFDGPRPESRAARARPQGVALAPARQGAAARSAVPAFVRDGARAAAGRRTASRSPWTSTPSTCSDASADDICRMGKAFARTYAADDARDRNGRDDGHTRTSRTRR